MTAHATVRISAMNGQAEHVTVVDLRIPFIRLVLFFVKAALAAIPAAIIVSFIVMLIAAVLGAVFGTPTFIMRRWTL
jgi:hypothetical protein